jgi:ubiquitin carboxyl-terminal hydrolase L5
MPPKGVKRKAAGDANGNGTPTPPLMPPDRDNWPGWVEFESEPALFNILLKDMGVRGVAIREVTSLDDDFMYTLPYVVNIDRGRLHAN